MSEIALIVVNPEAPDDQYDNDRHVQNFVSVMERRWGSYALVLATHLVEAMMPTAKLGLKVEERTEIA